MNVEKGFWWYLIRTFKINRQRRAYESILQGKDDEVRKLTRSLLIVDAGPSYPFRIGQGGFHYAWLEDNLKRILVTPQTSVGTRRRKLLQRAGYEIVLCGEEDYATCTIKIDSKVGSIFSKAT